MYLHIKNQIPKTLLAQTAGFLKNKTNWNQVEYYSKKAQKTVTTPRLTDVYGYHHSNSYTFQRKIPHELRPTFIWICKTFETEFNFILLAKYNDPNHSISFHSDDESFINKNTPIVALNLLEPDTTPFMFKLKNKQSKKIQNFNLQHGDIFYMSWDNQRTHMHGIPKNKNFKGVRYGITFRSGNSLAIKNYYKYN